MNLGPTEVFMNLTKWLLTAGCAMALGVPHAWPQTPAAPTQPLPDVSKFKVVERGTSKVVANSAPVVPATPAPPAPASRSAADRTKKEVVERPTANVVNNSAPATPVPATPDRRADVSKTLRIEPTVSKLVAATAPGTPVPPAAADPNNPTVEAGKVKWHKSLADARTASEKSGRPVLVFHMMGQLDKQFC
jgi:hypothetical protein